MRQRDNQKDVQASSNQRGHLEDSVAKDLTRPGPKRAPALESREDKNSRSKVARRSAGAWHLGR